jgi:hypothetical protein
MKRAKSRASSMMITCNAIALPPSGMEITGSETTD